MSAAGRLIAPLSALAIGLLAQSASAQTAQDFADWTSVSGSPAVATGTLNGASVTLAGTNVSTPPQSVIDGTATVFNRAEFTPPLANSDAIHFIGSSGNSYSLDFGAAVSDPVLHLGSIASTLEFPAGTQITRLSGDPEFSVSGSSVIGGLDGPTDDGNGSVRLTGTFTSIPFSTTFLGSDGIFLQVGVAAPPLPPPDPPPPDPPPPEVVEETVKDTCSFAIPWSLSRESPTDVSPKPQCTALEGTCPAEAECVIKTTVRVSSADENFDWYGSARASFNWCEDPGGSGGRFSCDVPTSRTNTFFGCATGPPTSPSLCPATATQQGIGPASVASICSLGWELPGVSAPEPRRGPDASRRLSCRAELEIKEATPLKVVLSTLLASIYAPQPGGITISQLLFFPGASSAAARPQRVIAPVTVEASEAGPVAIPLKLTKAGKKLLRRKGKLALRLRVVFTPVEGEPTEQIQRVTLRQPSRPPRR